MTREANARGDWIADLRRVAQEQLQTAFALPGVPFEKFRSQFADSTGCEISQPEFHDICSEALAWLMAVAMNQHSRGLSTAIERSAICSPFVAELLSVLDVDHETGRVEAALRQSASAAHFDPLLGYEHYLASQNPSQRLQRGVFYTPHAIARHIVERVDAAIREQLELLDGLADTTSWDVMKSRWPSLQIPLGTSGEDAFLQILDPAAGSGVFLVEVVDRIHRTMRQKWGATGLSEADIVARWNAYVPRHLLPRLFAVELMPTPHAISQLTVAHKLAETGYEFQSTQQLRFVLADTLLDPQAAAGLPLFNMSDPAAITVQNDLLSRSAFTVVIGNPPFRGISSNPSSWISKLLRGSDPAGARVASYYEVDGEPLRERKLWLQDDYVKFMRFAQSQTEQAGAGVVGLVTNHGYLDNTTFRGMRNAMLQTFQRIEVLDLHGNRKKDKSTPDGGVDEGVFEIEQGVAIGIFSRAPANRARNIRHSEVWGTREAKVATLADDANLPSAQLDPQPPHYLFVPNSTDKHPEYEAGFALNEIMPVNSTAVVTARDSFVVGFNESSLDERMHAFCDPSLSDDDVRNRYFTNSRSTKYPPGDTRGWKLGDARQRMMNEPDRQSYYRPCLYRPFDRRVIFWANWMIDWPRRDVMQHMIGQPNLALVARRQMPPSGPCTHFWVSDSIALDGLIRSDNRGSESVFPLWIGDAASARLVNFATDFLSAIASSLELVWEGEDEPGERSTFGANDVFYYIYALFNSDQYRHRYQESLRRGFPKVLIPCSHSVWTTFCRIGERLVQLHLMPDEPIPANAAEQTPLRDGFPKFAEGRIWLGPDGPTVAATERVWNFHAGTHQICRKWLRDRRSFCTRTVCLYERIIDSISESLELVDDLDETVAEAGGWEAAFSA